MLNERYCGTMKSVAFNGLFLFLSCVCVNTVTVPGSNTTLGSDKIKWNEVMDVSDFSIYYDLKTNETIKEMLPRPWYKPGWHLRLPFNGGPCKCEGLRCECCTGIRIPAFNYDRQTCANIMYEPSESLLDLEVMMNNQSVYRKSYSARNPAPFCVPVPVPYLPPGLVDMCVRIFDVTIMDQMLHMCLDVDTRVDKAPVLILHFDCMNMGLGGVTITKPGGSSDQTNTSPVETNSVDAEPVQVNADVFDPVTDEVPTTAKMFENSVKYI